MIRKITPPRLIDCNGNIYGRWYIIYRVFNAKIGRMQRFRFSKGFAELPSARERYAYAARTIEMLNSKLQDPEFDPFLNNEVIISDEIAYESSHRKFRAATYDISHFLNLYFTDQKDQLRTKSLQTYQSKTRIFIEWLEKERIHQNHPRFFTVKWATDFSRYLIKNRKLCNRTHNSYVGTLFSIWQWFKKKNLVELNPWAQIDMLKYTSQSKRPFSLEQSRLIMHRLSQLDPWLQFFCEFQYNLLTRPCSEQPKIKIDYIDFQNQTLKIPSSIAKNNKSQLVAIPNSLLQKMFDLKLHQLPKHWYVFGKHGPGERHASRDYFSKEFRKHLDALGIGSDWSMYSWKHTMNQRAAMKGIPVKEMQLQNRHHSLDQFDQYLKGLTVLDGKNLFDNLPEI